MKPQAADHLRVAKTNHKVAIRYVEFVEHNLSQVRSSAQEWTAVTAVYGAVHDVNAYAWETAERTFTTHHQRRSYVASSDSGLSSIAPAYEMLQDHALQARDMPGFTLAREALNADLNHLQRIAETVGGMLGVPLKI